MRRVFKFTGVLLLICLIGLIVIKVYRFRDLLKDTHDLQRKIEAECNKELIKKKTVGLAVGIIQGDRTYMEEFGYLDLQTHQPVDSNSIFEIGSVTKVFTSELTQILVDKGVLDWNNNIYDLLPAASKPHVNDSTTLLSLATHTSGFPRVPSLLLESIKNGCDPYSEIRLSDYDSCIKSLIGKKKANPDHYNYSNMGYGVLADCLEARTGKSFDSLLDREVFGVLGMNHTRFYATDTTNYATGYDKTGSPTCHWHFSVMRGAGGLNSNIIDMMKFLQANLSDNILYKPFSETQTELYKVPLGGIGKGWHMDRINGVFAGGDIIWKNGGTGGFRSYIGFIPAKKTGIVVLSNQADFDVDGVSTMLLMLATHISLQ